MADRRSEPEDRTLELQGPALRALVDQACERILAHLAPRQPSADTEGGAELARSLFQPLPESGRPAEELLDLLFERVIPKSFNTAGPGYLAYIPGGGLPHAAVADLISGATNRYVGVFAAAPGLAAIEADVVRWFCEMAGLPAGSGGILTSGGSLSNFSASSSPLAARSCPRTSCRGPPTSPIRRTTRSRRRRCWAGLPERNVREIPSDGAFRIRLDLLERAIAKDRAEGLDPFLVVGNAGTTNTGAVDDLTGLAGLARHEGLWFHADGAYGGSLRPDGAGQVRARGDRARRLIALDPHKGLFLPDARGASSSGTSGP